MSRLLRSSEWRLVGSITLVAFVVRLVFVLAVQRSPVFNDTFFYALTAESIAEGRGFEFAPGFPTAHWPPGYPLVLAAGDWLTGSAETFGEVLNATLGALTVPLLYLLTKKTFGRREAIVAAVILALLPGHVLWAEVLVAETLYTFLLVGFFLLLVSLPRRPWAALVLGASIGLITLTRGEGLLLVPVVLAVWSPALPRRRLAVQGALVVVAVALVMVPWAVRNVVVLDAFVPLSTNSSTTLWSGHNPRATGGQSYAGQDLTGRIKGTQPEVEEATILRREALEFMFENPRRELELIPLKLLSLNRGDASTLEWVNAARPGRNPPLGAAMANALRVVADSSYYFLLAATVGSLLLWWRSLWRRPGARGAIVLFAGAAVLFGFVYYGNYRYRAPLEPFMVLIASPLLVRAWDLRRR